ncbi:hypothetical protein KI387_018372, partial [Taxus chinensis]
VTDTGGVNVATGLYETLGVNEVVFWVVVEGMVDVMGATEVANATFIAGIKPNSEMARGKVDTRIMEPDGAD